MKNQFFIHLKDDSSSSTWWGTVWEILVWSQRNQCFACLSRFEWKQFRTYKLILCYFKMIFSVPYLSVFVNSGIFHSSWSYPWCLCFYFVYFSSNFCLQYFSELHAFGCYWKIRWPQKPSQNAPLKHGFLRSYRNNIRSFHDNDIKKGSKVSKTYVLTFYIYL